MYPEEMCAPMREDLTSVGFIALRTPESVSELLDKKEGTVLVMVNSVCGCAAGNARPAVKITTQFEKKVDIFATVFAGQDIGATAKAREYMQPFPPSSPSIAVFKAGKLVHFIERHHIEGRSAEMIADNLKDCFEQIC
ncbi:BrxA/BrxB family bacilliredoxin [Flavobacteriales bacterium]|nr:BrxA/BrxB family bacilliredoxin [Flavobacteriales bacterium]